MTLPKSVQHSLRLASSKSASGRGFKSHVFNSSWDGFVEEWAPRVYTFVKEALGPYGTEPLPDILPLSIGAHVSGATASFDQSTGQTRLSISVEGKPGTTLEKLTHEFIHGSLSQFPSNDCFYDESVVDYTTWVLAHAPAYGEYRTQVIESAEFNIRMRRERAFKDLSDYDRKRWAGGVFVSQVHGPLIVTRLKARKEEGTYNW